MNATYDAAIIPCTSGKRPDGMTPLTLYKGGPFSLMMRHAAQRCQVILIMSAKYGLLWTDDPVRYYDAYLPDLNADQRKALIYRIRSKPDMDMVFGPGRRVLSYLPKAYAELLAEALPAAVPVIHRPYSNLPSLSLFKVLSNEIRNYGTQPSRR